MLTAEALRSILSYDPLTGDFSWLIQHARAPLGSRAGCANGLGYWHIGIGKNKYRRGRLAWLYMTGEWPTGDVDHKNRNRADDRWDNLRHATRAQNIANTSGRSKSGLPKGVRKKGSRYRAQIIVKGREIHLGMFGSPEEAAASYKAAAVEFYGEFAA